MAAPASQYQWWRCPNEPPCDHAGLVHDVYDDEDQVPRCCADGCTCGYRLREGPLTREEYAGLVAAGSGGPFLSRPVVGDPP